MILLIAALTIASAMGLTVALRALSVCHAFFIVSISSLLAPSMLSNWLSPIPSLILPSRKVLRSPLSRPSLSSSAADSSSAVASASVDAPDVDVPDESVSLEADEIESLASLPTSSSARSFS